MPTAAESGRHSTGSAHRLCAAKKAGTRAARDERPDHTLNGTGLVHEAYLSLIDVNRMNWDNKGHFFTMASKVMRRILVNYALRRKAEN